MEAELNCSKLEIFRDILALEESALVEMTQSIKKIHAALQLYLNISIDVSLFCCYQFFTIYEM